MSEIKENQSDLGEIQTETATPESMGEINESPEQSDDKPKGHFKTVQQLALEYGMTKNGIVARINKMLKEVKEQGLTESDYLFRGKRNTMYVMPMGLEWLAKFNDENTPMQSMSVSPEYQELLHVREKAKHLESETEILKRQIEILQNDVTAKQNELTEKNNQISLLIGTVAQQTKTIDSQYNQLLRLTAPDPEPMGENAEETTAQNDSETGVSNSDDKITAELSKLSFMGKLKLLFS